jgi:hypothetical protein
MIIMVFEINSLRRNAASVLTLALKLVKYEIVMLQMVII